MDTTNTTAARAAHLLLADIAYAAGNLAAGHMLNAAANGEAWAVERCTPIVTAVANESSVLIAMAAVDPTPPSGALRGFELDGE